MYLTLHEVRQLVDYCLAEFNIQYPVKVEFNNRFTRRAGDASGKNSTREYRVRFSVPLFERTTVEERENTIIHEVAHIITFILYPKATGHGPEWRSVHRRLGREPSRCHNIDRTGLQNMRVVKCDCKTYNVTQTLYTRRMNQYNSVGYCKKCKQKVL